MLANSAAARAAPGWAAGITGGRTACARAARPVLPSAGTASTSGRSAGLVSAGMGRASDKPARRASWVARDSPKDAQVRGAAAHRPLAIIDRIRTVRSSPALRVCMRAFAAPEDA